MTHLIDDKLADSDSLQKRLKHLHIDHFVGIYMIIDNKVRNVIESMLNDEFKFSDIFYVLTNLISRNQIIFTIVHIIINDEDLLYISINKQIEKLENILINKTNSKNIDIIRETISHLKCLKKIRKLCIIKYNEKYKNDNFIKALKEYSNLYCLSDMINIMFYILTNEEERIYKIISEFLSTSPRKCSTLKEEAEITLKKYGSNVDCNKLITIN